MPILRDLFANGEVWYSDALRYLSAQKFGVKIATHYVRQQLSALNFL
jgi:hypothetical protein